MIKCVGCYNLLREELKVKGRPLVVYNCPRYFPYACALRGLLRPGSGIVEAVKDCPERMGFHCILCTDAGLMGYGDEGIIYICKRHNKAWGKWLDDRPEKREYIAPRGRAVKSLWVEVFREFIEDQRSRLEKEKSHAKKEV